MEMTIMPTPTRAMRLPPELTGAAEAKGRSLGLRTLTDCVVTALTEWTRTGESPALAQATARADAAERKAARARAELAKLRASVAADASLTWQEDRFIAALVCTAEGGPVTTARLIAVSGWQRHWVARILPVLVAEGCITRVATGHFVIVPGADLREGIRVAREQAQRGAARIAPSQRLD
jgi:hypothetical protein